MVTTQKGHPIPIKLCCTDRRVHFTSWFSNLRPFVGLRPIDVVFGFVRFRPIVVMFMSTVVIVIRKYSYQVVQ